jgi:hypothetical protein
MDQLERIARLEAQQDEIMRVLQETRADMKEMRSEVRELDKSLTRWKGIGAGIVIAVSVIWSGILGLYHFFAGK